MNRFAQRELKETNAGWYFCHVIKISLVLIELKIDRPTNLFKTPNGIWISTILVLSTRENGAPDRDRTGDPLLRRQLLYPTELQARGMIKEQKDPRFSG